MRFCQFIFGAVSLLSFFYGFSCRYTIREIGFSSLSNTQYILYRVGSSDVFPKRISKKFIDSNIATYATTTSAKEATNIVRFIKENNLSLPAYVLKDSSNNMLSISEDGLIKSLLESPFQHQMIRDLPDTYAIVLLIKGKDCDANIIAKDVIDRAVLRIENNMPNMPKSVRNPPVVKELDESDFQKEKILLWSLGIQSMPKKPRAFIFYGKGRLMGEVLAGNDLSGDNVYRLLSFIGADCECGLDRKWMFGLQVPLSWGKEVQDRLRNTLNIDVNHPMVLSEMGRILATKKKEITSNEAIAFEPVEIDLNTAFNDDFNKDVKEESRSYESVKVLYWWLGGLAVLVLIVFLWFVRKK